MLFLEMEITSFPQMEKPETPSLCPLTTKGSGVQLLFIHKKKKNPLLLHVNIQKKNTVMTVLLTSSSPRYVGFCQESWKQVNGSQVPLTARKKKKLKNEKKDHIDSLYSIWEE